MEEEVATTVATLEKIWNTIVEFCVNYSFQVVGALIVLMVGVILANWVAKVLLSVLEKKKLDITLAKFLVGIVKMLVITFTVLIALGKFGITIAPFIAALGALAFGASFAIQGPLSNYGAGLSIIMSRPFIVGNTISVSGVSGVVEEVKLACTILKDEEGVRIMIPNKHIVGEILHNSQENKVVEGVIGISYDSDVEKAIEVISKKLQEYPEISTAEKPKVGIQEFADSSVNIGFRYWVPTIKFFQVSYQVNLGIYRALQDANINIPFPQRDVRIISQPAGASSVGLGQ